MLFKQLLLSVLVASSLGLTACSGSGGGSAPAPGDGSAPTANDTGDAAANTDGTDADTDSNTDGGADTGSGSSSTGDTSNSGDNASGGSSTTSDTSNVASWSAAQVYNTGDRVSYNGQVYAAGWWTQGSNPAESGQWGVWQPVAGSGGGASGGTADTGGTDTGSGSGSGSGSGTDTGSGTGTGTGTGTVATTPPGKVVGTYFVEWGVYGRNYHVNNIPASKLTHILYGFIPVCGPNASLQQANASGYSALQSQCAGKPDYSVVVHDSYAALEKSYPGDNWDDPIKGNFGQFIKLKQQYPHLKVIPSVGGWTLSDPFFTLANNATHRATFVNSVKQFLTTYAFFDGVDIDWEFPGGGGANGALGSSADYNGYVYLMRDLRAMLDTLEPVLGKELQLTSAVGAGPDKISNVNYAQAQPYMDYIFVMSYDYYGAWNHELGHQAGLYANPQISLHTGYSAHDSISNLQTAGVPASKLVLGVAAYGRGWKGVQGSANDPFAGQGKTTGGAANGTWEAGVQDYKDLETNYLGGANGSGINGYKYFYDDIAEAAYLWNVTSGTLISFDDVRAATAKGQYAGSHDLAGVFSWEIDADNGQILDAMNAGLAE